MSEIKNNLERVKKNIADACVRSGRNVDDITLIAVSKTKPVEDIREAVGCGMTVFGENKVQELREKTAVIADPLKWHMIGHLQVNKVKYLPGMVELIHSVDNEKLAHEIDRQAARHSLVMDVLCEVNMAGEESKFGLAPGDAESFVASIMNLDNLRVRGLMTIAPYTDVPEANRRYFKGLRELMCTINKSLPADKRLDVLSMGMTGDYEIAVEEGATMVRVGTGIFGERNYMV